MPNLNVGFLLVVALCLGPACAKTLCKDTHKYDDKPTDLTPERWGWTSASNVPNLKLTGKKDNWYFDEWVWGACAEGMKTCKCGADAGNATDYAVPPIGARDPATGRVWQACTACNTATNWTNYGTGYQRRETGGTCSDSWGSTGVCSDRKEEFMCETGYCGSSTDGKTGCALPSDYMKQFNIVRCQVNISSDIVCPDDALSCIQIYTGGYQIIFDHYPTGYQNVACYGFSLTSPGYMKSMYVGVQTNYCITSDMGYYCAQGYSGWSSSDGTSGCAPCPSGTYGVWNTINGSLPTCVACPVVPGQETVSAKTKAGATSISECYMDSEARFQDARGTYGCGAADGECHYNGD